MMTADPIHNFERLVEIARAEAAPESNVTDSVMQRLSRVRLAHTESLDRSRLWFAGVTTAVALITCVRLWPGGETTLESYALLWSPLGEVLP